MSKEAIGIAINGRDVKIAHVYREKNRLTVDLLEKVTLATDPEADVRKKVAADNESTLTKEEDVFAIKNHSQPDPIDSKAIVQNTLYCLSINRVDG